MHLLLRGLLEAGREEPQPHLNATVVSKGRRFLGWGQWGQGSEKKSFSCAGIQISVFWAFTKGRDRSRSALSWFQALEPSPGAGAMGDGQAWGPGSHLPRTCEMVSSAPPSCQYPALSLVSCQSVLPREGRGTLISDGVWGRAPRPLGSLRSGPRGLRVISPARPEGNPTWEPGAQDLLLSALQHQVRV